MHEVTLLIHCKQADKVPTENGGNSFMRAPLLIVLVLDQRTHCCKFELGSPGVKCTYEAWHACAYLWKYVCV